ncbi:MAG: tetratricopeptide repeat protein [Flavobacteriales bacterium]|nr:tetratricopeptide repeat protein [Flavobacteriales bacterium]
MVIRFFFTIIFLAVSIFCYSQHSTIIDSLNFEIKKESNSSKKLNSYFELVKEYYAVLSDSTVIVALKGIELAEKINDKPKVALFHNAIGMFYLQKTDYALALQHHLTSLKIRENLLLKKEIAISINNIGLVYQKIGNFEQSLNYFQKALEINKELKNKEGISLNLGNLSIIYSQQKDFEKAIMFAEKSLQEKRKLNDSASISATLSNIGNIYYEIQEFDNSLKYLSEALIISKKINYMKGVAIRLINIGELYKKKNNIDSAYIYFNSSLDISKKINDLELTAKNYQALSDIFYERKKYKEAYEYHKKFFTLSDSVFNQNVSEQISEMSAKYETEKKQKEIELLNKENEKQTAIAEEQSKKKNIIIFSSIAGLLLVTVFSLFLFNRFNLTKKQKAIIEEKQQEITDSITYAKRLQTAILPPDNYWKKHLPESFVMYQPKDIVSGDFYWLEDVNDLVLFASADCTGHGVSGAMVSVICSNALNRTVKEFGITEPSKILNKIRELVLETFEKSESDIKDGMDISLCSLNTKTNELLWSGANSPLWYIRENELNEIKPDKQPIGKTDNPKPFTTHKIELLKGDTIYIFTDGYADQFGGEKGKKFMYKPLKNLLQEIHKESLSTQKEHLQQHFANWKGTTEQTDDVLIIGVRI